MSWAHSDLRILLLGRTGSGKSSTANTILGRRKFRENVVTPISKRNKADVGQRTIIAIDTPGLFNPAVSERDLMTEIRNGVSMSDPGPHVILLVMRLDVDLTEDEKNIVTWIENNFGNDAVNFTFILFTHAGPLNSKSAEDRISESPGHKFLIDEFEDRYHLLNNMNRQNRDQVTELLKKIEQMVQKNMGQYCNIEVKNTSDEMLQGIFEATALLGIGLCALMGLKQLVLG